MRNVKTLKTLGIVAVSLLSMAASAGEPKDSDFDPSTVVPGFESIGAMYTTKEWARTERRMPEALREYGNREHDQVKEIKLERRMGSIATGALAMDALQRGIHVFKNEKTSDDYGLNWDHLSSVGAGGLAGLSASEYIGANHRGSIGNRTVGGISLMGAAYLGSKGDRKSTELAMGHAAALVTLEQGVHMARFGAASQGRFFTPKLGLASTSMAALTLYSDVFLAERRAGQSGGAAAASIVTDGGLKPATSGLAKMIEEKNQGQAASAN